MESTQVESQYERFEYPGRFRTVEQGDQRVRVHIEQEECERVRFRGKSTCPGFAAGSNFELQEHDVEEWDAPYLLLSVQHFASIGDSFRSGDAGADELTYHNEFTAMSADLEFRPPRRTPKPLVHGSQTALVVGKEGEEIWTDKYGRIKVQFPWDRRGKRDQESSCWIRVAQLWAGKQWGAMFLPRVGQEVVVDFLDGDPDRPLVTGCVCNADNMPPYGLPGQQTKSGVKSLSSKDGEGFNELRFEDKKGEEQLFMHAERDLDVYVKENVHQFTGGHQHQKIEKDRKDEVGMNQHHIVGKNVLSQDRRRPQRHGGRQGSQASERHAVATRQGQRHPGRRRQLGTFGQWDSDRRSHEHQTQGVLDHHPGSRRIEHRDRPWRREDPDGRKLRSEFGRYEHHVLDHRPHGAHRRRSRSRERDDTDRQDRRRLTQLFSWSGERPVNPQSRQQIMTGKASIKEQLRDRNAATRKAGLARLLSTPHLAPAHVSDIGANLYHEDETVRHLAITLLQGLGRDGALHLGKRLESSAFPQDRVRLIAALASIGTAASSAMPAVCKLLGSRDSEVRWHASFALGRMGDAPVKELHALLVSTDQDAVRIGCCDALRGTGKAAACAENDLATLAKRGTPLVSQAAWSALHRVADRTKHTLKALEGGLTHEEQAVRLDALERLGLMREDGLPLESRVTERLRDPNPDVRALAALTLARIKCAGQAALNALTSAARDEHETVRTNVLIALEDRFSGAPEALTCFRERSRDVSESVKQIALSALARSQTT